MQGVRERFRSPSNNWFLEIAAIKAVHRLGWGKSAAVLFLPAILLILLCALIFVGVLSLAGLSFNKPFQQMQQGY